MPAFTYVATVLIAEIGGIALAAALGSTGLALFTGVVATGLAYVTSKLINGGNNDNTSGAASSMGGRIQVPPATNNKIPVLYGQAFVNGIITDARITDENKTMVYVITLSETTNVAGQTYTCDDIYWNDLRMIAQDGSNSHKIARAVKYVDNDPKTQQEDFIDNNFNNQVEVRVYAGNSTSAKQIYPAPATGNTQSAYDFVNGNKTTDAFWTSSHQMEGVVFAVVKIHYEPNYGFTGLPNMTFKLTNSVCNPADVWQDYMTSKRYGANIPVMAIDTTAQAAYKTYCDELITYTSAVTMAVTTGKRYTINGLLDTGTSVKSNIDSILQNSGAWMSYDIAVGKWRIINKRTATNTELNTALQFNDDNIVSGITLSSTRLDNLYNKLEVEYYDRNNRDQRAYVRTDLPLIDRNPNEPDNQLRLSLSLTNNNMQAEMLGNLELKQSRYDLVIEFTAAHYGIQAQAGDIIKVTSDLYNWQPKLFRVQRVKETEAENGLLTATITAVEYDLTIYDTSNITEFVHKPNNNIPPAGGTGNLLAPAGLEVPANLIYPTATVPNFTVRVTMPNDGGPYDNIQIWYARAADNTNPDVSAYKWLMDYKPQADSGTFTLNSQHNIVVTQLPATVATDRYYIKARLGNRGNYGPFTSYTGVDLDTVSTAWVANPVGQTTDQLLGTNQVIVGMDFGKFVIPNNGYWLRATMTDVDCGNWFSQAIPIPPGYTGSGYNLFQYLITDLIQLDLGSLTVQENTMTNTDSIQSFKWQ